VDREGEPVIDPRDDPSVQGRDRGEDEGQPVGLERPGGGERGVEATEDVVGALVVASPLGREIVDGDEPRRP
jgi:hypothetical protein